MSAVYESANIALESFMRTRLSICRKKARHPTYEAALAAARAAEIELRPYHCDRCRQYHLTSRLKGKWMPRER